MPIFDQNNRQMLIEGWGESGQEALSNTRVLIVGADALGQMLSTNLAGLGIGNMMILDNGRITRNDRYNFLYSAEGHGTCYLYKKRAGMIADRLNLINENIKIEYRHSRFSSAWLHGFKPEILIDATASVESKEVSLAYAIKNEITYLNAIAGWHKGIISAYDPHDGIGMDKSMLESIICRDYIEAVQGPIPSSVISGLVAEEVRKHKITLGKDGVDVPLGTGGILSYNLFSSDRISQDEDESAHKFYDFKNLNVLMVGAGAIGNYAALNLSLIGFGNIDIVDDDDIEAHNLNRQFAFYGAVGQSKAEVLSGRVREFNPLIGSSCLVKKLGEDDNRLFSDGMRGRKYDIVFGCVDNYDTRKLINGFCVSNVIPYIDGGTTALAGQVATYVPGRKKCVDCQLDFDYLSKLRDEKRKRLYGDNSCIRADPSVVIPNIIIGGSMVGEAIRVLYDSRLADCGQGIFKYNSFSSGRIGNYVIEGGKEECKHGMR